MASSKSWMYISFLLINSLLAKTPQSDQLPPGLVTGIVKEIELPILMTKQDLNDIRYISNDGKFTYYQQPFGNLIFSTNYGVKEVIKLKPRTQFKLISTNSKKIILVEADESYHTYLSTRTEKKIFTIKYGTHESTEMGIGTIIGLHVNDSWISYYNHHTKLLTIQNPINKNLKANLKLANNLNPYFIPDVVMTDTDTVLFTDINKKGIPGILKFNINANKTELLYKSSSPNKRLHICLNEDSLYLAETGLDPIDSGTQINIINSKTLDFSKPKSLYVSEENDLGSFICNYSKDYIYFIKTLRDNSNKLTYDAFQINVENKEAKRLSEIHFASSLILMDQKLLLPYQDKYFIIKGVGDMTKFDRLKALPKPEKK